MKRTVVYFEKPGKEHTEETLRIALEAAKERGIDTVLVASTTGSTALKAMDIFEGSGINLVVVTHQVGFRASGLQLMPKETREKLEQAGVKVVTCTDALSGGIDLGIARQRPEKTLPQEAALPYIVPPVNRIVANVLWLIGEGVKVCVEISMMAADVGAIPVDRQVVAVAGNHSGSDTAIVITPSTTNRMLNMRVHELLAKPL